MRIAKVMFYRDKAGEWRWRLKATNGRIVADSGEGYQRLRDCLRGWNCVSRAVRGNSVLIHCE